MSLTLSYWEGIRGRTAALKLMLAHAEVAYTEKNYSKVEELSGLNNFFMYKIFF